ncbi:MAG: reverse transcriptase family protein [Candidatus Absconditabacteria bacterium]|nr:reverse transcriptase family protein [Candidatus Absconditabacteria bacterium]
MKEKILKISTLDELSEFFSVSKSFFNDFESKREDLNFIDKIRIPKRKSGYRIVYNILDEEYRKVVEKITYILNEFYIPHQAVHGFVSGKSIVSNASNHLNKAILINLDIKNFFESISIGSVMAIFIRIGLNNLVADIFSRIVCYKGHLIAGFSTSPVISNMYCSVMDNDFMILAKSEGYRYTRYADDITFSTDNVNLLSKMKINQILNKFQFVINEKKYFIQRRGGSQYVTGLSVCEKDSPRIPKSIKKNIRLESYYIKKYGIEQQNKRGKTRFLLDKYSIMGWISYMNKIEPKLVKYIADSTRSL